MRETPGYTLAELLFESDTSSVYRATRQQDGLPVVLKMMRTDRPAEAEIVRYRQEYEIAQKLRSVTGVINSHEIVKIKHAYCLVLEDIGGISLGEFVRDKSLTLKEILTIASEVAAILGEIHRFSIVHKDINLSNILIHPQTKEIRVIDFGISTLLSQENLDLKNPNILEGTLPYISPEQTGRMNRKVDYRSDFYSFGAAVYELLTGRPPFVASSPLEYVHCHIAKQPEPPCERRSNIPKVVSDIVMKLLSKTAESRYKSAFGIRFDLLRCIVELDTKQRISLFDIGENDVATKLIIPEKLYGREAEIEELLLGFERVAAGNSEFVLLSGRSGIGKSALVKEIYRPLTRKRGFFISGKFDQLQSHRPYSALIGALEQLVKELLLEDESQLLQWQKKIVAAIGASGELLIEIVPDLELIIGKQPSLPELPPTETENRFNWTLRKFIEIFASRENPLVVAIDDLQWADSSSLRFIELLMTSSADCSLYFLGSYRNNEVNETHPLMSCLRAIENSKQTVNQLELSPLSPDCVNELVCATLAWDPSESTRLAELICAKTNGNPFFICEFLDTLASRGLIYFDTKQGKWCADIGQIEEQGITDNVVELMAEKLSRFGDATQEIITVASCLGSRFNLGDLVLYFKKTAKDLLSELMPAILAGSVIPIGDAYKSIEHLARQESQPDKTLFKFAHDRIQQAAYTLIDEKQRENVHLLLGQLLLESFSPEVDETKLFDITNHLNIAYRAIDSKKLRNDLAELNLRAGRKAKLSAAFDHYLSYGLAGLKLMEEDAWQENYDLMLQLTEDAAEAALLCADFEMMRELSREVDRNARSSIDKAKAYRTQIEGCTAEHRPKDAVQTGLSFLRLFGIKFPLNPNKLQVIWGLIQAKAALKKHGADKLLLLPEIDDPRQYIPVVIMRHMATPAYYSNPYLMVLLIFKQVRMLIRHGNSNWSASVFASFGLSLCGVVGDIENGYQLGKIALSLLDKYPNTKQQCRTRFVVNTFVRHWKDHVKSTLKPLEEAYQLGLETGDLEWGCLAGHLYCEHAFFVGKELSALEQTMSAYSKDIGQFKQSSQFNYNEIFRQVVLNLQGENEDPRKLRGAAIDDEKMLPELLEQNDNIGVFAIYLLNIFTHCLYGDYQKAVEYADLAAPRVSSIPGMFAVTRYYFLDSLARLAIYENAGSNEKRRIKRLVKKNLKKLEKWARFAPANHKHLHCLVLAEFNRISGCYWEAAENYDASIELAEENGFLSDEAIALEKAASFYLSLGKKKNGGFYLEQAQYAYTRWGADSKVRHLEASFGKGIEAAQGKSSSGLYEIEATAFSTTAGFGKSSMLDFMSIIKATQGLSRELVLSDLLDKLMHAVVENVGATKGVLVLEQDGELWIEARLNLENESKTVVGVELVSASDELSESIVRYVSRTSMPIVLGDAIGDESFGKDSYVLAKRPKSILCSPILRHRKLIGIVYLENNNALDAFSDERLEVVNVLSAQAAISIDNAELYTKLKKNALLLKEALHYAEEHSKAKSEFLAKTSHELRTPLNSIINIPEGLLNNFTHDETAVCKSCNEMFELEEEENVEPNTPCPACHRNGCLEQINVSRYQGPLSEVEKNLKIVHKASTHLLNVVNDILDISRIESGHSDLHPEVVNIMEVFTEVIETTRPIADKQGIEVLPPEKPDDILVYADPVRLSQILLNLVSNAIKFSPAEARVELEVERRIDKVVFSVRDYGIGISKEDQKLIFESFRQVEGDNTRKYGGTGLGLAITKNLVDMHCGKIWVESEQGLGSQFFVKLPLNYTEEEPPKELAEQTS